MNQFALEQYLYEHIPLSKSMQISVVEAGENAVILSAPLAPNINHTESIFGGSASAVAILAAWSLVHVRLQKLEVESSLVIQRNSMNYELPISGAFTASSFITQPEAWDVFVQTLVRRGRARINISSTLEFARQKVGSFEGDFVAFKLNR